jgi:hypothetical protein
MLAGAWKIAVLLAAIVAAAPVSLTAKTLGPQRIIAIGDLHGDDGAWRDVTRAAGLVDTAGRWTGGTTILVQTGDVPDRGPHSLLIIRDLMRLQKEAKRAGGQVIALVGNHEAMNIAGDLRYVDPGEYAAFVDSQSERRREITYADSKTSIEAFYRKQNPNMSSEAIKQAWLGETPLGWVEHRLAWSPKGEIGKWVLENPAVALVGDTLFVHGGISATYGRMPIDAINRRLQTELAARDESPTAIINDEQGPLWYRRLVMGDAKSAEPGGEAAGGQATATPAPTVQPLTVEQELDAVLAGYGARRMVVAHTPMRSGIGVLYGGRLVDIDTGMSRYYNGVLSYLEINGDQVAPHTVTRTAAGR